MAMTKEQRNQRLKQKRSEWKAEVNRLRALKEAKEIDARNAASESASMQAAAKQASELLEKIHVVLLGPYFRAWYEATTGGQADEFIAEVVISPGEYFSRFKGASRLSLSQLEWTKCRIENLVSQNPWTNPERKSLWAEELKSVDDPRLRRSILLKLATPRWANEEKIVAIYQLRDKMVKETGVPHDVDHIIPIVNQLVCGLHCEFNLRVIPASENRRKSNKFDNSQ